MLDVVCCMQCARIGTLNQKAAANIFIESSIHNPYLNLKGVISSGHMGVPSRLLVSPAMTMALTAAVVVAIAIILLAANITITKAQQQQQPPLTSQPAVTRNATTLFQSIEDGIKLNVPEG
jgi:hypothetical protein